MWHQSLGIRDPIPKNAKICSGHFDSSEILVTSNGQRLIKKGAIPIEAVDSKAPSTDHNYAKNSNNESETFFLWQIFLLAVFGLYLLLDYFINTADEVPECSTRKHFTEGKQNSQETKVILDISKKMHKIHQSTNKQGLHDQISIIESI